MPTIEEDRGIWDFTYIGGVAGAYEVTLEKRVEISGRRTCSLEINGTDVTLPDCSLASLLPGQMPIIDQVTATSKAGLSQKIKDWVKDFLTPPPVPLNACFINSEVGRQNLSTAEPADRFVSANAMLNAVSPGNTIGRVGKEYKITFADGGTETYVWSTYDGVAYAKIPSDLVKGSGVSQCP